MDWNLLIEQLATIAFDIVLWAIIIGTILVIVMDNRNPVKTMAWILVLIFVPVAGLVLYIFFGRSRRHENLWRNTCPNPRKECPMTMRD